MEFVTPVSKFSFLEILNDGQKALDCGLYKIALMFALTIPSICSRIEFKDNPEYKKSNGDWKDKKCYVDWCRNHCIRFANSEIPEQDDEYISHIYKLRCAVVHAAEFECGDIPCELTIDAWYPTTSFIKNDELQKYDISIIPLCKRLFFEGECFYLSNYMHFKEVPIVTHNMDWLKEE